ncbi:hypothetical protein CASFOL_018085 [Castilleja foliolosa]|uniref:CCHC-type domain-containing protein n=1 Tax=Castilleja foliolosa TaxID=1961234 RepID=A0ABD3DBC0_9LAMI
MIVARWPPDKSLDEIELDHTIFWVHIFGLPVSQTNLSTAREMGNNLGRFITADLHSPSQKWKKSMRMQIEINTTKPLVSTINIPRNDRIAEVRYERLIEFCHKCGHLGHKEKFCSINGDEDTVGTNPKSFGPWMKYENHLISNPKISQINAEKREHQKIEEDKKGKHASGGRNHAGNRSTAISKSGELVPLPNVSPSLLVPLSDKGTSVPSPIPVENPSLMTQKDFAAPNLSIQAENPPLLEDKSGKHNCEKGLVLKGVDDEYKGDALIGHLRRTKMIPFIRSQDPQDPQKSKKSQKILWKALALVRPQTTPQTSLTRRGSGNNLMKILVWNCRGLAQPKAIRALRHIISDSKAELIFISEVKSPLTPLISSSLANLNFNNNAFSPPVGKSGGLLMAWKNHITLNSMIVNQYFIHSTVTDGNKILAFTAIYAPCYYLKKDNFWKDINNLALTITHPWIMAGDFNDIIDHKEKKGGLPYSSSSGHNLANELNNLGLIDLGFNGYPFTWDNKRNGVANIQQRLDRAVSNMDWLTVFPQASVTHLNPSTSDHCPILITTCPDPLLPKPFRFDNMWFVDKSCIDIVHTSWKKSTKGSPSFRLELVDQITRISKDHWLSFSNSAQGLDKAAKHWIAPPPNWTKVNVDASFHDGIAFTGVVFRNCNGSIFFTAVHKHLCLDAFTAESLAMEDACKEADRLKITNAILESDCINAISFINVTTSNCFWSGAPVIERIKSYKERWLNWNFKYISKISNGSAHALAHWGSFCNFEGPVPLNLIPIHVCCDSGYPLVVEF